MTTSLLAVSSALLNVALQVTLMAALLLLLLGIIRRRAVWRYHLAYSGLIAVALLALTSPWLQQRESSSLNLQAVAANTAENPIETADSRRLTDGQAGEIQFEEGGIPQASIEQMLQGILSFMAVSDPQSAGDSLFVSLLKGIAVIWLAGTCIALLRMGIGALRLRRLIRKTSRPTTAQLKRLQKLAASCTQDQEEVEFMMNPTIRSPVHVGFFQPAIILPEDIIEACSDSQLQSVIAHELAHWQRRDNLANLVQGLIVAMFWFHPLIHALDRVVSRSREEICDNYVLAHQDPLSYSETLLLLSSNARRQGIRSEQSALAVAMFSNGVPVRNDATAACASVSLL